MELTSNATATLSGSVTILNNPVVVNESGNDYKDVRAFVENYGHIDLFVKDTASFYDQITRYRILDVVAHDCYFVIDTPYIGKDRKLYLIVTSATT